MYLPRYILLYNQRFVIDKKNHAVYKFQKSAVFRLQYFRGINYINMRIILFSLLFYSSTVQAQRQPISIKYFNELTEKDLIGQKLVFLKTNQAQPYGGIQKTTLFNSKVKPDDLVGKTFTITEHVSKSYPRVNELYVKIDGMKGAYVMYLQLYKQDGFPIDIGVPAALDSAKKALIGRKVYDNDDNEIIVKDIEFAADAEQPDNDKKPFKFTLQKNGKTVTEFHHIGRETYQWFNGNGNHEWDIFGYKCYEKSSKAAFGPEDIATYFSIRQNKVDNLTEYKIKSDGESNTTVIYENETNLAPILLKSKNGTLSWKLVGQYYGDNFIWHKQIKITVDETSHTTPANDPITKVMDAGYVMERHVFTGAKEIALIKLIAENYDKDVAIRFVAEKGRKDVDYELSAEEKYKFKRIYDLYQYLLKNKK